jgi:AbrB family looped-hinge helix DNA binding protein
MSLVTTPALTVKSQVTVPKFIRDLLGIGPGQRVCFEPLPNGQVLFKPLVKTNHTPKPDNPFAQFRGVSRSALSTDEQMREWRGDGWNQVSVL